MKNRVSKRLRVTEGWRGVIQRECALLAGFAQRRSEQSTGHGGCQRRFPQGLGKPPDLVVQAGQPGVAVLRIQLAAWEHMHAPEHARVAVPPHHQHLQPHRAVAPSRSTITVAESMGAPSTAS